MTDSTPIGDEIDGGNAAKIRARAFEISDRFQETKMTHLDMGFAAVSLALTESAIYLREAADLHLDPDQMREMADRLDGLADDTCLLADAAREEGKS